MAQNCGHGQKAQDRRFGVQNLLQIWQNLDFRKRLVIGGATLAVFLAVLAMSRFAASPGMSLLYAGLPDAAAGDVISALDQRGMIYDVRGGAIYVEETQRDSLRMALASEGLPANSGAGYELLDGLSGFGTTSQMFDAAYWRAKEGELARTILSNPLVRSARVHIAQAPSQPFQRATPPSASVTITTSAGTISAVQASALRHLIAAAVPGMTPEEVAVIDTVAGLIGSEGDVSAPVKVAASKADEIRQNIERLLAARVGPGHAVVEVAVDVVTESESITERRFDPQGRVAISTDTEQKAGKNAASNSDVTVASNLPTGDAGGKSGNTSENTETRERVNFEVSETNREVQRSPGAVRKISVAVLVDGQNVTAADGTTSFAPRPEDELSILRELVTSAAGLDSQRGDVLTLKSLLFQPTAQSGEIVEAGMFNLGPIDLMTLIQVGLLTLVVLVLGLFVIRPILRSATRRVDQADLPMPLALPGIAEAAGPVLTGEIDHDDRFTAVTSNSESSGDPMSRLRRLITERQAESVEILRGWMEQEEEVR